MFGVHDAHDVEAAKTRKNPGVALRPSALRFSLKHLPLVFLLIPLVFLPSPSRRRLNLTQVTPLLSASDTRTSAPTCTHTQ